MKVKDPVRLIRLSNDLQTVTGGIKLLMNGVNDECRDVESPEDASHFCVRFQEYATSIYLFLDKLETIALDLKAEVAE